MAHQKIYWVNRFNNPSNNLEMQTFSAKNNIPKSSLCEWNMNREKLLKEDCR